MMITKDIVTIRDLTYLIYLATSVPDYIRVFWGIFAGTMHLKIGNVAKIWVIK